METRHNEDTGLPSGTSRATQFAVPIEYTSQNLTAESQEMDPPPSYSSFQKSFVRNFSLPYPSHEVTSEGTSILRHGPWQMRLAKMVTDWWLFEILSWVIGASCMGAIALLLGRYDNHSLPSRWPGGISLNTSVSVLSAIAKFFLSVPVEEAIGQLKWIWVGKGESRKLIDLERFDDASRGPWGSFTLIMHMRGRSLVSLAGTIVLVSLALDPFFQQLTAYPKRPAMFGKSSLTRTVTWKTQNSRILVSDKTAQEADYLVGPALERAFLAHGQPLELPNPCPSNNCEWPPFETLGICSQCEDVSDQITYGCLAESGTWQSTSNYTIPPLDGPPPQPAQVTSCGWFMNATGPDPFLMTGYTINTNDSSHSPGEALWMRMFNLHTPVLNHSYWGGSLRFKNTVDTLPLFDFMIAAQADVASVYANKAPQVAECVFRWCTKKMSASVVEGNYTETVISTFTNDTVQPNPIPDNWIRNRSGNPGYTANISITPPGQGDTFSVPSTVVFQTIVPFNWFVPSYFTSANVSAAPLVRNDELAGVWNYQIQKVDMTLWVTPTNLSAYAEHIATTMTNVIRTYPNSSEPVSGFGGLETYIHIQWVWFCLPLFVLFSTLFVLIITLCKGPAKGEGGVWKCSSLAMMLHGLDEETRREIGESRSMFEIKSKAREISVALRPEVDGYRFHRVRIESDRA